MNYDKIMYWLCIGCVIFNAYIFLTSGSILALLFGALCAFGVCGRK